MSELHPSPLPATDSSSDRTGQSAPIEDPAARFHCLPPRKLERFLQRRRANPHFPLELNLAENLAVVLRKANEFVPSAAGSILLDDPARKRRDATQTGEELTFIAAFGSDAERLVGRTVPAHRGIAGHVYRTGGAYSTADARRDRHFYAAFDEESDHVTLSLIAIPIRIEQEVCGVLELINRRGQDDYDAQDRNLLEIFAGYISISIQNVLDGRQAQEIAKRDNLTGLYNDRYLHIALSRTVEHCRQEKCDLAVLFLDLDFFKRVNDTHGHLAGSQVLREVGEILRERCDPIDALAARYGGDEFVVVAPDTDLDAAVDLAEDIRSSIMETVFCSSRADIQREPLHLTGLTSSVGVATLTRHLADETASTDAAKSTLLRLADSAMYVAKETGRNRTAVAGEPIRRRR